tara:strand:+ start:935 stop:1078 length:144 start_codon:yes stop_codon:yes gene_type:complete
LEGWQSGNAAPWKGVVGNGAGVRFPHLPPNLAPLFKKGATSYILNIT